MKFSEIINERGVNWEKVNTIPEFIALSKTPQSKRWHQEGDVLTHTKLVVKEMLNTFFNISGVTDYYLVMVAAALCHDLGKATTTRWDDEKDDFTSPHHAYEGEKIVRRLFFDEDIIIREKVCFLVRWHMTMHHFLDKTEEEQAKTEVRLSYGTASIADLILLGMCDAEGSINEESLDRKFIGDKFYRIRNIITDRPCPTYPYKSKLAYLNDVLKVADDKSSFNVTLMIGVAGAGKDTWVNDRLPDDVMLSRDNIRTEIGLKGEKPFGTKEQEKEVTRIFNERLLKCCENHQNVVINNTNLLKKYRTDFVKMVLPYNPFITFVYVEPNEMGDCAKRRKGQIKKEIVDGMWDRLDFPDLSECNRLLLVKQDAEGDSITRTTNGEIVYK